jgi:dihydroflavonol-4-reductase
MKALVTGANGLIGSNVVRVLLQNGHTVRAFVRRSSNLESLKNLEVELAYGDILDSATLAPAMKGCDTLFHIAAVYSYWGHSADELMQTAQQGTLQVLEAAVKAGVRKVVFTSSSVVRGFSLNKKTISENQNADTSERSAYVVSKIAQEQAAFEFGEKNKLDVRAVCPAVTVGAPDFNLTESNRMIVRYLKDPLKATWLGGCNIVSVKDVAAAHLLVAENGKRGERYLAGSENLEWQTVHRMISELAGLPGPYMTANHTSSLLAAAWFELAGKLTQSEPMTTLEQAKMVGRYYWYDHSKLAALGYQPMPARQALTETISWLAASPHIPVSVRAAMRLSDKIYDFRNKTD